MANGVMGFPAAPPVQQPSMYDRVLGGLLGAPQSYGGLLSAEDQRAAQQKALMAMGAQLMAASGPSPTRTSLGQALGPALMAGQQAQQQSGQDMLQAMLLRTKLSQKERKRPTAVMGPNGQPIFVDEQDAIGKQPYMKPGSEQGAYQPGDYTTESWAKFQQTKNPADLVRYSTPRQDFSPSFQNVTRTLPDGSTQQGTFNTRTGEYDWRGPVVPAGTKARTDAAGRAEGEIEGTRTAKAPTAYATYQAGIKSLEEAMAGTITNPVAGRIPAMTAGQQIAEGAEATMAPVLKELFRSAGEGTFTEGDQKILMDMVPNRKDHPEARKAKIQMIDGIVRAKLGMDTNAQAAPQQQAPSAAIEHLRKNPQLKEQFKAKYGYVPDGI